MKKRVNLYLYVVMVFAIFIILFIFYLNLGDLFKSFFDKGDISGKAIITKTKDKASSYLASKCVDTDNGRNIYEKGIVSFQGKNYTDSCYTQNSIAEYYCIDNNKTIEFISCPQGYSCLNGICITIKTEKDKLPTLDPPNAFGAFPITANDIFLIWENDAKTNVKIMRSASINGPFELIADISEEKKSYLDSSLSPDTIYYYTIKSYSGNSEFSESQIVKVKTLPETNKAQENQIKESATLMLPQFIEGKQVIEKKRNKPSSYVKLIWGNKK
ncbi:fibronectin type III domain-containing protein [Candidatus Pacearchaeota archaeon]|nr:fibronectin type III domain-containing protein [Candidatus Pacearchaeota archaeon]